MKKDKIDKESGTIETARDKGVTSTDWLGNFGLRIIGFLSKLPCFIDIHDYSHSSEWYPSRQAKIVTEYKFTTKCLRCGKTHITHQKWNENIFIL
jgi:hypothetical protein